MSLAIRYDRSLSTVATRRSRATRVSGALPDSFVRASPREVDHTVPLRSSLVPSARSRATLAVMRRSPPPFGLGPRAFRAGVPAVEFGPIGGGHHGPAEWVSASSLDTYRRTLVDFVRRTPDLMSGDKPHLKIA